jgi:protein-disulfide isomerase-like protein with CxxC motif
MFLAAATDPAPWWGAPLIAALAALSGVALTLLGTAQRSRAEQRHKDRSRWDDEILEASAEIRDCCTRMVDVGKVGYPNYIADDNERTDELVTQSRLLKKRVDRLSFIASTGIRDASMLLYQCALEELFKVGRHGRQVPSFAEAEKRFIDAVRREIRANE